MMMDNRKKKIAIVGVCSILLVAMVVAIAVGTNMGKKDDSRPDISTSQKAIQNICQSTEYQETCLESLKSSANSTTDTKELIELAFQAAIKYISAAAKNSTALQAAERDPQAKSALESCRLLVDRAVGDLQRTLAKFQDFDVVNFDNFLSDMKIWLSGAITYQETCLDGFEKVPGDSGEKMREALTTAMQMTSNGLAMMTEISTILESMGVETSSSRRLLSENNLPIIGHDDEYPDWVDSHGRRLLTASTNQIRPDLVVAKDGSGAYKTINEALVAIPKKSNKTFVMYIKEGVYVENVKFNSSMINLMIIGDGPTKTRITGSLNFIDGTKTYHTATVGVDGDNFVAKDIGFENSAGPEKHQAVALRVSGDKAIFHNCHMDGYQDTLYAHTYRQFYRDCAISGTIDFIFGDSAAVFQGCTLLVRKPMDNQQCIVTAQGRKDVHQPTGLILQNCTFKADPEFYPVRNKTKSYLGRPWKEYSRTVVMESYLDDMIDAEGWLAWNATFAFSTLFYSEFNNRGPAAAKHGRVKWPGVKELPPNRVQRFTVASFLDGGRWIEPANVPYVSGFIFDVPKEDPNIKYSPVVPEEVKDLGQDSENSSYISSGATAPSASPTTSPSTTTSPTTSPSTTLPTISPSTTAASPSSFVASSRSSATTASTPTSSTPSPTTTVAAPTSTPSSATTIAAPTTSPPSPVASPPSPTIVPAAPTTSPPSPTTDTDVPSPTSAISPPSPAPTLTASSPAPTTTSSTPITAPTPVSSAPTVSPVAQGPTSDAAPAPFLESSEVDDLSADWS